MKEKNITQEFRLRNIDETRNYLIQHIKQNELINRKYKNVCTTLNYIEHFLILAFAITGCISVSAFAPPIGIPKEITSSAIGLKIGDITAITAGIKIYKSIIKRLAKSKLNSKEILISKALIDQLLVMMNLF